MLPKPPSTPRLRSPLTTTRVGGTRTYTAFFLFGLLNNILYVILLTAAVDLVGPSTPKSLVLLADVVPSFFAKLTLPYIIQRVPYNVRVCLCILLSIWGMLLVGGVGGGEEGIGGDGMGAGGIYPRADAPLALASEREGAQEHTLSAKMAGIILASLSSGLGEMTFLGLTHFYGPLALAAWGSGTGAAGLVGAGMYAFATGPLRWTSRMTVLVSAVLPLGFVGAFWGVLDRGVLAREGKGRVGRTREEGEEGEGLLAQETGKKGKGGGAGGGRGWGKRMAASLRRSRGLVVP